MAKKCMDCLTIEEFGIVIGKHFVSTYPKVLAAKVALIEKPWERVSLDGKPHEHDLRASTSLSLKTVKAYKKEMTWSLEAQ